MSDSPPTSSPALSPMPAPLAPVHGHRLSISKGPPPLPSASPAAGSQPPPPPPAPLLASPQHQPLTAASSPTPAHPPPPPPPPPIGIHRATSETPVATAASPLLSCSGESSHAPPSLLLSPTPSGNSLPLPEYLAQRRPSIGPPPLPSNHRASITSPRPPPLPPGSSPSHTPHHSGSFTPTTDAPPDLTLAVPTTPTVPSSSPNESPSAATFPAGSVLGPPLFAASPSPSAEVAASVGPAAPPAAADAAIAVPVTYIPEEVDPGKTPEERLKRYGFRKKVAEELLSTERSYVASLTTLQTVYINALTHEKTGILTSDQAATLFSNIPVLLPFQEQFLTGMQETLSAWSPTQQAIGPLFIRYSPFLKMSSSYCHNFDYATSLLQKLEKSDSFVAFCRRVREAHPATQPLQAYLIQPIQRTPRYLLLISELLRYTNPLHPDYALLTRAKELMAAVALHINEAVRKQQSSQTLLTLQEKFHGSIQLIGSNVNGVPGTRRLVKQGPLSKKGRRSDARYEFLLFSDFLLYARQIGAGPSARYKLHRKLFINAEFAVSDVVGPPSEVGQGGSSESVVGSGCCFQILSAQKSFIVHAKDAREKQDWLACLGDVVAEFKKAELQAQANGGGGAITMAGGGAAATAAGASATGGANTPLSPVPHRGGTVGATASSALTSGALEIGAQQPIFHQFKSNSVCSICAKPATFSSRHHCRCCGSIVCSNCSRDRIYLSWTRQCSRTCDRCCQRLKDERSAKLDKIARLTQGGSSGGGSTSGAPMAPAVTPSTAGGLTSPRPPPGPPPRPPILPARPHQDTVFRLLNELLETAPRIETEASVRGTTMGPAGQQKHRAMSVFIQPASASGGAAVDGVSGLVSPMGASPLLPVPRFVEGTEKPKLIGKLAFVKARGATKQRSHSVMVSGPGQTLILEDENDGLSESDDENEMSTVSSASSYSSYNMRDRLSIGEDDDQPPTPISSVGRVSLSGHGPPPLPPHLLSPPGSAKTTPSRLARSSSLGSGPPTPLGPPPAQTNGTAPPPPTPPPPPPLPTAVGTVTPLDPPAGGGFSSPPPPPKPRLSGGLATGGGSPMSGIAAIRSRIGASLTLGGARDQRAQSVILTSSPSSTSVHHQSPRELLSPHSPAGLMSPATPGRMPPPALPARRSHSLIHPQSSPQITPERYEKRKSIMQTLAGFFTSRPSEKALREKKILQ